MAKAEGFKLDLTGSRIAVVVTNKTITPPEKQKSNSLLSLEKDSATETAAGVIRLLRVVGTGPDVENRIEIGDYVMLSDQIKVVYDLDYENPNHEDNNVAFISLPMTFGIVKEENTYDVVPQPEITSSGKSSIIMP